MIIEKVLRQKIIYYNCLIVIYSHNYEDARENMLWKIFVL